MVDELNKYIESSKIYGTNLHTEKDARIIDLFTKMLHKIEALELDIDTLSKQLKRK